MFFDAIITYSLHNKLVIGMLVLLLAFWGIRAYTQLPIDAVPDITNNQVQIITQSPALAALEIEQLITSPLEISMSNLPMVEEVRSISRFGLSVITVVFTEDADLYKCRQLTAEQIKKAEADIPANIGRPTLAPITTGLGEIYQYTIDVEPGYEHLYDLTQLRTTQDWIVKRQLSGIPGVIEVSSFGGNVKEYEVSVDPGVLEANKTTLAEVYAALGNNNSNTGGSYLEKAENVYFIRAEGMIKSLSDIENSVVKTVNGTPLLIRHIGKVKWGKAVRYGAMTINGQSETAGGIVMMLRGANSAKVIEAVKKRIADIQKSLPKGLVIVPFLDRSKLVNSAVSTVATNLIEGGLIVIFVLVLLLGNLRAGLIVASVIPLAMLFAIGMMELFGISANLMSLGAIDFGLVVDGAVIIVESIYHHLVLRYAGLPGRLNQDQLDHVVHDAALGIRKSASFGEIIILMVYLPILALVGVEGKMFRPMAETVIFTIIGALILSLTWVPVASALFMPRRYSLKRTWADRFIGACQRGYLPLLKASLRHGAVILVIALGLFGFSLWQLTNLGGEFMPELDEGDFAVETRLPAGSSLSETTRVTLEAEKILLKYPEVSQVIGKIGTSEVPTDPMPLESADLMVVLKPRKSWPDPSKGREELAAELEEALSVLPGVAFEFQQPIQMRFNELMTGVRSDVAIKIYGDSLHTLFDRANDLAAKLKDVEGINAIKVEAIGAVPQLQVNYDRAKLAAFGLNIASVNQLVEASFAGGYAGQVYEGERRFGLVVRLDSAIRQSPNQLAKLLVPLPGGGIVPLGNIADVKLLAAPMQISRDNTHRRIVVGVGVAGRDMESVVNEIKDKIAPKVKLPSGYYMTYGGQFQNFERAKARLMIAVPLALMLIFVLLFITFGSVVQALLIFTAIPLSAIGGVWALTLRGMPFSISAGVGFIALFGVAVLNGIVLIGHLNGLRQKGHGTFYSILVGAIERLRPVMLTALVASLGFIPMALSTSGGAEVQRPLATVVIGGLVTSTILTLVVLPVLYLLAERWKHRKSGPNSRAPQLVSAIVLVGLLSAGVGAIAQPKASVSINRGPLSLVAALDLAKAQNPAVEISKLELEQTLTLVGTAFDPTKTTVDYQFGRTQVSTNNDYTIAIGQTFALPGVYNAQRQVYDGHAQVATSKVALTQAQVSLQVRNLYFQYLSSTRRSRILQHQIDVYTDLARVAAAKLKEGESIKLAYLSASAKNQELSLLARQEEADRKELVAEIAFLLRLEATTLLIDTSNLGNRPLTLPTRVDSVKHPELDGAQNALLTAQAQTKLENRRLLPEVKLGYGNQSIEGVNGQQFAILGLNVPLFARASQRRKAAAQIATKAAGANIDLVRTRLSKEIQMRQRMAAQYQLQLQYYQQTGLRQADELINVGLKSYKAGEVDYSDYILSTSQAWDIRLAYQDLWQKAALNINVLLYLQGQ